MVFSFKQNKSVRACVWLERIFTKTLVIFIKRNKCNQMMLSLNKLSHQNSPLCRIPNKIDSSFSFERNWLVAIRISRNYYNSQIERITQNRNGNKNNNQQTQSVLNEQYLQKKKKNPRKKHLQF